jgi:hypothetical protein
VRDALGIGFLDDLIRVLRVGEFHAQVILKAAARAWSILRCIEEDREWLVNMIIDPIRPTNWIVGISAAAEPINMSKEALLVVGGSVAVFPPTASAPELRNMSLSAAAASASNAVRLIRHEFPGQKLFAATTAAKNWFTPRAIDPLRVFDADADARLSQKTVTPTWAELVRLFPHMTYAASGAGAAGVAGLAAVKTSDGEPLCRPLKRAVLDGIW